MDSFSFAEAVTELCERIENRIHAHVVFVNTFKVANESKSASSVATPTTMNDAIHARYEFR